jgi:N4-gp56 family major capsid protein
MAIHNYSTVTPRIGKIRGAVIAAAMPQMSIGISGRPVKMEDGMADTMIYRSYIPIGATSANPNDWVISPNEYELQEGFTPDSRSLNARDIPVTLKEYGILYRYSKKQMQMGEDNVPDEMKKQAGQAMGLLKEKIQLGVLRGCTNQYFAGGTTRATVSKALSITLIRLVVEGLQLSRSMPVTTVLKASNSYATQPVSGGYMVFGNSVLESDIRDLPKFIPCEEYASGTKIHPMEIGACERFRFILTPEIDKFPDSGAAVGQSGLTSTTGTNIDVVQAFVVANNAWSDVALRGLNSMQEHEVAPDKVDHADPMGRSGFFGIEFWAAPVIENDEWMAVINCGITNKTA